MKENDQTARTEAQRDQERQRRIHYDYLTGLPNQIYFLELAEKAKWDLIEQGQNPVLLFMDLSG